jgi:hypothetical protein
VCYLVGVITAAATARHQRLGDMVAGTVVVRQSGLGHDRLTARSIVALSAVVVLTLAAGVSSLAADHSRGDDSVGAFAIREDVIPYADRVIADGLRLPSVDGLRTHLAPGIVSDDDLATFVATFSDATGGMTDDYQFVDEHRDTYTLPSGARVEAVTFRIDAQFVKRPGELELAVADVEGQLRLIGFHFAV